MTEVLQVYPLFCQFFAYDHEAYRLKREAACTSMVFRESPRPSLGRKATRGSDEIDVRKRSYVGQPKDGDKLNVSRGRTRMRETREDNDGRVEMKSRRDLVDGREGLRSTTPSRRRRRRSHSVGRSHQPQEAPVEKYKEKGTIFKKKHSNSNRDRASRRRSLSRAKYLKDEKKGRGGWMKNPFRKKSGRKESDASGNTLPKEPRLQIRRDVDGVNISHIDDDMNFPAATNSDERKTCGDPLLPMMMTTGTYSNGKTSVKTAKQSNMRSHQHVDRTDKHLNDENTCSDDDTQLATATEETAALDFLPTYEDLRVLFAGCQATIGRET